MNKYKWRYYNRAIVPTTAPHEEVDSTIFESDNIWNAFLPCKPLLARWTSDFDCGYTTNWWYVICERPFSLENLSRSSKKNIKKSLRLCEVKRIEPLLIIDDLYNVYLSAVKKYRKYQHVFSKEEFINNCQESLDNNEEWWGGYDASNMKLIGYMSCAISKGFMEMKVSKYCVEYLHLRVSDAINYIVIEHYLNSRRVQYILNGSRAINHITNVQNYYIERFGFRKAYCKLHIKYRFFFKLLVNTLYPFRKYIPDSLPMSHQIKAILQMEEIVRSQD